MKVLQSFLSWNTKQPRQWFNDTMCHTPIKAQIGAVPPLHNTKETRVVNVGMPKSGSTSTNALFKNSGFNTSHWICGKKSDRIRRHCGNCMFYHIQFPEQQPGIAVPFVNNESLFQRCGDFQVWTQLDIQDDKGYCIFPQIEYLEELYLNAPNATWLMPMRNVSAWVSSVNKKDDMRDRFGKCDFRPHLNFAQGDAESDEKMMELYCTHIDQVRDFVESHPTLSYIEYRIEDSDVGSYLKGYFPALNESQWEQKNMWYEGREEDLKLVNREKRKEENSAKGLKVKRKRLEDYIHHEK